MSRREDGEIRDAARFAAARRRRPPDRRRSRSRSRSPRRRHHRPAHSPPPPPRRPRYDDSRRQQRGGPPDRRRRSPDAPRKVEHVVRPAPPPPPPPDTKSDPDPIFAQHDDDVDDDVDEDVYAERVERQLQSITAAHHEIDVDEELRRRRERRLAMLQALPPPPQNVIQEEAAAAEVDVPGDVAVDVPGDVAVDVPNDVAVDVPVAADDVDIFGDSPIVVAAESAGGRIDAVVDSKHLTDNWDDAEGYYSFRLGDALNDARYEVFAFQGRGVFSTVLRVRDRQAGNRELVVKVIRRNDVMYKAGLKEVQLLKILGAHDPDNHRHCVRLYSHFEHRGHLCLVFEPLHLNLREVLKKYGGVGINIDGVRSYARQLFVALRLLGKCDIVHADIKPDNILVNAAKNVLKLCDFGSAGMVADCEITPYLVSRFYRAPEIILGLPYGPPIDVWAVGCVLFELYTGQILFKGADNNDMLFRVMELRGRFPPRLLRKATFAAQHFDEEFAFERRRTDRVSGAELKTKMRMERPVRDLQTLLRQSAGRLTDAEMKSLSQLRDLLEKCLMLDPAKRITPEAARSHPFLQQ